MTARSTIRAIPRVLLAGCLALAWLLSAGAPAGAVDAWRVTAPGPGGTVKGTETIKAEATANPLQRVEVVQVRLLRLGSQVGPVRATTHVGGPRSGGISEWTTPLDPLRSWATDGQPMPNGPYTLQARVIWDGPTGRNETGWAGHDIVLDVAPPATQVTLRTIDTGARSVEVSWTETNVPDFRRYVVQRASESGSWSDIGILGTRSTTQFVDAAPAPGTWRYRVAVVRAGGVAEERRTDSAARTVVVGEPGQPDPTAPIGEPSEPAEEPDPDGSPEPADGDGEGDGDGDGEGDGDGDGDGDGPSEAPTEEAASNGSLSSSSGVRRPSSRASVPSVRGRSDAPAVAQAPAPNVSPADDTFVETLPYADPTEPAEIEPPVRRGEALEGGSLAVYDREIQMEQVLPPVAGGLLLFVVAGHVLRLRRD